MKRSRKLLSSSTDGVYPSGAPSIPTTIRQHQRRRQRRQHTNKRGMTKKSTTSTTIISLATFSLLCCGTNATNLQQQQQQKQQQRNKMECIDRLRISDNPRDGYLSQLEYTNVMKGIIQRKR